jgi:hypothetical protein
MTSIKPVPENAVISIRDNFDRDSNLTEESDLHPEKQLPPKNPTESGMVTNVRSVFPNVFGLIRSN